MFGSLDGSVHAIAAGEPCKPRASSVCPLSRFWPSVAFKPLSPLLPDRLLFLVTWCGLLPIPLAVALAPEASAPAGHRGDASAAGCAAFPSSRCSWVIERSLLRLCCPNPCTCLSVNRVDSTLERHRRSQTYCRSSRRCSPGSLRALDPLRLTSSIFRACKPSICRPGPVSVGGTECPGVGGWHRSSGFGAPGVGGPPSPRRATARQARGVGGWHRMSRCRWVAPFVRFRSARCRWPAFAPEGYGAAGARCRWVAPKGQDVGAAFAPGLSVGGTECHATSWARSRSRLANSPRGSNRSSIQCRNHVPQHHLHSLR